MRRNSWTDREHAILDHGVAHRRPPEEIQKDLPGRTLEAIRTRGARRHGVSMWWDHAESEWSRSKIKGVRPGSAASLRSSAPGGRKSSQR